MHCLVKTVLVDALFFSKIWQTESEFGQSPEMIPIAPLEGMKALSQQSMLLSNNIQ
jgi:hypothetical protein